MILSLCFLYTESTTTGDSSQQDGGDIGPSFIEHLPESVSQLCKLYDGVCLFWAPMGSWRIVSSAGLAVSLLRK